VGRILLVTFLIWLVVSAGLAVAVHTYGYEDHVTDADTIIVLGAGLTRNGNPTGAQRNRTRRAAELWHEGHAPNVICTGGSPWYTDNSEAQACKDILVEAGVPANVIYLEDRSRSTQENALYSKEIMDAHGWTTAVVVSDRYHLLRANWLFNSVGIQASTTPNSVGYLPPMLYIRYVLREVAALQWQAFATLFNLPYTHFPIL
jgi:uncharacterized SAM-binding protein YcdF (DUF218 family)